MQSSGWFSVPVISWPVVVRSLRVECSPEWNRREALTVRPERSRTSIAISLSESGCAAATIESIRTVPPGVATQRDRCRSSRSCPGRRRAARASRTAVPSGRACRRSPSRRAGGTSPSRRRPWRPTSCTAGSARGRPRTSRRGRAGGPASARRGRRVARARRSRSSRSRGTTSASPPRSRAARCSRPTGSPYQPSLDRPPATHRDWRPWSRCPR